MTTSSTTVQTPSSAAPSVGSFFGRHLLKVAILVLAWVIAFASRMFSVIRFESIIHEFDPWFNYRVRNWMKGKR